MQKKVMIKFSFIFILAIMLSMSFALADSHDLAADDTNSDTPDETNTDDSTDQETEDEIDDSTDDSTDADEEESSDDSEGTDDSENEVDEEESHSETDDSTDSTDDSTDETTSEEDNDVDEEFADEEFDRSAGLTPDSPLYFLEDAIFTRFRGDIANREKKIAEIKKMIEEENYADARKALAKYKKFADKLEEEVDPERKEEARRTAARIRKVLRELRDQIPEEDREEFVDDIVDQEGRIATAAEIAAKIKDLCETLAKVDPSQYARTCKTDDDAPKWKKDLDKRLTGDQKEEAEKFFRVMSQCFEDASQCQCDEISVTAFAEKCSVIAPLAAACDGGDENACDEMDAIEDEEPIEDLLPPHLQEVLREMERYNDARHENHIPRECEEAGVTDRKGCMRIMFEQNAPPACVKALENGEIDLSSERKAREQCEAIAFLDEAPQECIEEGIKDHRECGAFMFEQNAPIECIEAGLTGESPRDHRECDKIRRSMDGDHEGPGRGFAFGANCAQIDDKDEKLECFENAFSDQNRGPRDFDNRGPGNFEDRDFQPRDRFDNRGPGNFDDRRDGFTKEDERRFAKQCEDRGGAWNCGFGGDNPCRCDARDHDQFRDEYRDDHQDDYQDNYQDDYQDNYDDNYDDNYQDNYDDNYQEDYPEKFEDDPNNYDDSFNDFQEESGDSDGSGSSDPSSGTQEPESNTDSGSSDSGSDSGSSDSGGDSGSDSGSSDSGSSDSGDSGSSPITGEVTGNDFLDYYYR